jgi:hypothetical protein
MPGQRAYDKHTERLAQVGLTHEAQAVLAGWPTPKEKDGSGTGASLKEAMMSSNGVKRESGNSVSQNLKDYALLAGWQTPKAADTKGTMYSRYDENGLKPGMSHMLQDQAQLVTGTTTPSSPAATENQGALNPAHSRWLMGFPVAWCRAAILAMRSYKPQRNKES